MDGPGLPGTVCCGFLGCGVSASNVAAVALIGCPWLVARGYVDAGVFVAICAWLALYAALRDPRERAVADLVATVIASGIVASFFLGLGWVGVLVAAWLGGGA